MKFIAVAVTCLSLIGINSVQSSSLEWNTNVEKGKALAKLNHKPLLIYFTGSDWCGPCKSLSKDFFESSEFSQMADQFILVKLDIPRRIDILTEDQLAYNKAQLKKLNPSKKFPTLIAFNFKGKEIKRISSYSGMGDPTAYFKFLEDITK